MKIKELIKQIIFAIIIMMALNIYVYIIISDITIIKVIIGVCIMWPLLCFGFIGLLEK